MRRVCVEMLLEWGEEDINADLANQPKPKDLDFYYYYTNSLGSARKIIKYLDNYHMLSSKHVNFLK